MKTLLLLLALLIGACQPIVPANDLSNVLSARQPTVGLQPSVLFNIQIDLGQRATLARCRSWGSAIFTTSRVVNL